MPSFAGSVQPAFAISRWQAPWLKRELQQHAHICVHLGKQQGNAATDLIRYRTKTVMSDKTAELIGAVVVELRAPKPDGVRYLRCAWRTTALAMSLRPRLMTVQPR
jgi:hypothetical protein